jgi:integrase
MTIPARQRVMRPNLIEACPCCLKDNCRRANKPLTTRYYARLMDQWTGSIGLDPALYRTHSLRRTKVALIYRRTGNLRAVQLLLGHTKLESTVLYLGIAVDDALAIAEQIEI